VGDYSRDGTVVEYAVQSMFKGKSLRAAARSTAKKFDGQQNMFIGSFDQISIDADVLEDALWDRIVGFATASMPKLKAGKEQYALYGALQHFRQCDSKTMKVKDEVYQELKKRVVAALGGDPFTSDEP
jgi:hypothetical protein